MLRQIEALKLQNLLAIYQLQTADGMVLQYHDEWEQDPVTGRIRKVSVSDDNDCCDCCCLGTGATCCCADCICSCL